MNTGGGSPHHPLSPMIAGTFFDGTPYASAFSAERTETYVQTEILHYQDGSTVVNSTKTVNRVPRLAVSRVMTSGSRFTFWNDHDPRIVSVELVFDPA